MGVGLADGVGEADGAGAVDAVVAGALLAGVSGVEEALDCPAPGPSATVLEEFIFGIIKNASRPMTNAAIPKISKGARLLAGASSVVR